MMVSLVGRTTSGSCVMRKGEVGKSDGAGRHLQRRFGVDFYACKLA